MTIITVLDTETTGLKVDKGHRIIEVALVGYDLDTEKKLFEYVKRVNPNRSIEPKAQLIHKISQADLIGKPSFADIEPFVTKILSKSSIVIGHNLNFDVDFIVNEYALIGKQLPDVQGFDTMAQGRWATSLGKNPNLSELCYACEIEYDPDSAHSALYDVEVTAACFFFALKHGAFNIKELLK